MKFKLVSLLPLLAIGLACAAFFQKTLPPSVLSLATPLKVEQPAKTVMQVVAEEQAKQAGLPSLPAKDPELKMKVPGIAFIPEKMPPTALVIDDPQMGQVVELRYSDGSKLYKMKDPVYNINTGEVSEDDISK